MLAQLFLAQADGGDGGGLFAGVQLICWLIFAVLSIAGYWVVFSKAGKPGWAAIIPIYNIIVLLEIVGRPIWWIILLLIPFVNILIALLIAIDLAKSFGQGTMYGVLLWLFQPLVILHLAFGGAQYVGPGAQMA